RQGIPIVKGSNGYEDTVLIFIVIAGNGNATAQQSNAPQKPKVRRDVSKRVQEKGVAKVGVMLSGQWELDSKLTKEAALAQRQAIAAAQKSLMAELAGTRYKVISNSKIGPYMSLEVGPDAVAVLEGSNLVKDVYLDEMVYRPGLMDSVPLIRADQAWAANYDRTGQGVTCGTSSCNCQWIRSHLRFCNLGPDEDQPGRAFNIRKEVMKMKFYLYLFMITLAACTAAGVSAAQQS